MSGKSKLIGRDALLDTLWQTLRPDSSNTQKAAVLYGAAGIGKTEQAHRFSQLNQADDSNESGFAFTVCLDASSEITLRHTLAYHLWKHAGLGRLEICDTERDAKEMIKWLGEDAAKPWLLILDNFEPDVFRCDISKYLPKAEHGSVLVVTRDLPPDGLHASRRCFDVGKLPSEDAVTLLSQAGQIDIGTLGEGGHADLHSIVGQLDGVPQALVLAGVYISRAGATPSEYRTLYTQNAQSSGSDGPLRAVITLSYRAIENNHPLSAKLLNLMSCYHREEFWYSLISAAIEEGEISWLTAAASTRDSFDDAVAPLIASGLVEVRSTGGSSVYFMRRAVQESIKSNMGQDELDNMMSLVIKSIGYSVFTHGRKAEHFLLRHADFVYDNIERDARRMGTPGLARAVFGIASLYFSANLLDEAELMYSLARVNSVRDNGSHGQLTLDAMLALGKIYGRKGRHQEAEAILFDALAGYTQLDHPGEVDLFEVQDSLGAVYRDQNRDGEAEELFRTALRGYTAALGPYHTWTLQSIENMVDFYVERDRLDDALGIYEQHLADCRAAFPPGYTALVEGIRRLIVLYRDRDAERNPEADALRPEIDSAAARLPKSHCTTYHTIHNIGLLYLRQDKFQEAEDALYEALLGKEIFLGFEHRVTLRTFMHIAVAKIRRGFLGRAQCQLREVLGLIHESENPDEELRRDALRYMLLIENARADIHREDVADVAAPVEDIAREVQRLDLGYRSSRL
ncbi:P-loop containing nucleoside triphosphate hydrolase protein [Aspergillus recurvatus]